MHTGSNDLPSGQGIAGLSATTLALVVSMAERVEIWLRIVSLMVGIAVGIASFISIIRRLKK